MGNRTREDLQQAKRVSRDLSNGKEVSPSDKALVASFSRGSFSLDKKGLERQLNDVANRYGLETPKPMYKAEQDYRKNLENRLDLAFPTPAPRPY